MVEAVVRNLVVVDLAVAEAQRSADGKLARDEQRVNRRERTNRRTAQVEKMEQQQAPMKQLLRQQSGCRRTLATAAAVDAKVAHDDAFCEREGKGGERDGSAPRRWEARKG